MCHSLADGSSPSSGPDAPWQRDGRLPSPASARPLRHVPAGRRGHSLRLPGFHLFPPRHRRPGPPQAAAGRDDGRSDGVMAEAFLNNIYNQFWSTWTGFVLLASLTLGAKINRQVDHLCSRKAKTGNTRVINDAFSDELPTAANVRPLQRRPSR